MPIEAAETEILSISALSANWISRIQHSAGRQTGVAVLPGGRESLGASSEQACLLLLFLSFGQELADLADGTAVGPLLGDTIFPAVVDGTYFEASRLESLNALLGNAFESDPIEDGITHPAERIIDDALFSTGEQETCAWLGRMSVSIERPGFAASVLRCLARRRPGTSKWRAGVVRESLSSNDVEMRDAAVQAAEAWGGTEVQAVLRGQSEEVPWLRKYIDDVLEDLGG